MLCLEASTRSRKLPFDPEKPEPVLQTALVKAVDKNMVFAETEAWLVRLGLVRCFGPAAHVPRPSAVTISFSDMQTTRKVVLQLACFCQRYGSLKTIASIN